MRRVKENWFEVFQQADAMIKTALGLAGAEIAIGTLMAIPEPTGGAKTAAITLQLLLIYLAVEAAVTAGPEAIDHGTKWWALVKSANGNFDKIWRAAQEFGQMVYYLVQSIASVVGVAQLGRNLGRLVGEHMPPESGNVRGKEHDGVGRVEEEANNRPTSARATTTLAEQRIELLEAQHRLRLERLDVTSIEVQLCTTCAGVRVQIDRALKHTQPKGPTKSMRRRLERLRGKVVDLETRVENRVTTHMDSLPELEQIGRHLVDISKKYPSANKECVFCAFEGEIDYPLLAKQLGFERIRGDSHGQRVFRKGNTYITPDVDRHLGGVWKKATGDAANLSTTRRDGTYNEDLTERIGK